MNPSDDNLVTSPPPAAAPRHEPIGFTAGVVLGGRYRIVGLLGKGGMGEVYRADDLTLQQTVALKFLPASVATDADRLERMREEVRTARQVSHPNVCRVYDIGVEANRPFLTMEYVDGEDLASLLRRIGQLAPEKAFEIARQLCAGLSAAHERGVIHRDLKPANIMLDGRGKVRLMDFGLAVAAESARGEVAGTPAYMAPEQIGGQAVSVKTDLYAVGLVIYEVMTGRRFFTASSLHDLRRQQTDVESLRVAVSDAQLPQAVERVIAQCLDPDPARRPDSALGVARTLPGSDPLAAALAAGETPSPSLVAAAGDDRTFAAPIVIALLVAAVVATIAGAVLRARDSVFAVLTPQYSTEILSFKAREMLTRLGYTDAPVGIAAGSHVDRPLLDHVNRARWPASQWKNYAPVHFWQRTSPRVVAPSRFPGGTRASITDPPPLIAGMTRLETDTNGRLILFEANPSRADQSRPIATSDPWHLLFTEAGLDPGALSPTEPQHVPPAWGDRRAAWTGTLPADSSVAIRIEVAAFRERPTYFTIDTPWTAPPGAAVPPPPGGYLTIAVILSLIGALFLAAFALARRNVRGGRADRRGAARLASVAAVLQLAASLLVMTHVPDPRVELVLLLSAAVWPMITAAAVWVLYVALEPYMRRTWPSGLITWNRLLEGRFRDPRVGADLLVGVAGAMLIEALRWIAVAIGDASPPKTTNFEEMWMTASSLRETLAILPNSVNVSIAEAFGMLLFYAIIRMLVRRELLAAALFVGLNLVLGIAVLNEQQNVMMAVIINVAGAGVYVFLLVRFGLVTIVSYSLAGWLIEYVATIQVWAWYGGPSITAIGAILLLAAYGAWTALTGASHLARATHSGYLDTRSGGAASSR